MVQAEILKIMGFWTQLGVSGFRMDAVPFVILQNGAGILHPKPQYDMLRRYRELLQWRQGDAILLGEANVEPKTNMQCFGTEGERLHMMFNFPVNQNLFLALASADGQPLQKALEATRPRPATSQWGTFLRNHDELDLGRLSDEPPMRIRCVRARCAHAAVRPRHPPAPGADARQRPPAPWTRLQPDADDARHARVLRYGDEIGMGDDLDLPERECARTPMQWSTEPHGGFTRSDKPVSPVIDHGVYSFEHVNVAQQRRDPDSLLDWMERVVGMRKEHLEVGWGDFKVLPQDDPAIFVMRYDWRDNSVLFIHNLGDKPCELQVKANALGAIDCDRLINLLSEAHSEMAKKGKHSILLEPYGYR